MAGCAQCCEGVLGSQEGLPDSGAGRGQDLGQVPGWAWEALQDLPSGCHHTLEGEKGGGGAQRALEAVVRSTCRRMRERGEAGTGVTGASPSLFLWEQRGGRRGVEEGRGVGRAGTQVNEEVAGSMGSPGVGREGGTLWTGSNLAVGLPDEE